MVKKSTKTTRRRKRPLTQQEKLRWLQLHPKPRGAGRLNKIYAESLHPISEEELSGLTLALYSIMLNPPRNQEHLVPNKRHITLLLPHNFRALYGREMVMGRLLGYTEDRWHCRYQVRVCRLFDFLYKKGLIPLPRSAFTSLTMSVRAELRAIEKELDNLIPQEVLEKLENKIQKEVDNDNAVVDNDSIEVNNTTGE